MKIFISWSGEISKQVAEALREWLPNVIQALDPWMSSEDIDKGARWYVDIISELETAHFGIICLTPENIGSSWVHFEAGALSKSVEKSRVCPYLFQIDHSIIKGPLTLYQMTTSTEKDTREMIHSINNALPENALSLEKLDKTFDHWWPDLNKKFEEISKIKKTPAPKRPAGDMVEEILEIVRSLSRRSVNKKITEKAFFASPEYMERLKAISQSYEKLPEEVRDKILRTGARD